jgi:hypothetical protein
MQTTLGWWDGNIECEDQDMPDAVGVVEFIEKLSHRFAL